MPVCLWVCHDLNHTLFIENRHYEQTSQKEDDLDSRSLWLGKLFPSDESIFSSEKNVLEIPQRFIMGLYDSMYMKIFMCMTW